MAKQFHIALDVLVKILGHQRFHEARILVEDSCPDVPSFVVLFQRLLKLAVRLQLLCLIDVPASRDGLGLLLNIAAGSPVIEIDIAAIPVYAFRVVQILLYLGSYLKSLGPSCRWRFFCDFAVGDHDLGLGFQPVSVGLFVLDIGFGQIECGALVGRQLFNFLVPQLFADAGSQRVEFLLQARSLGPE